MQGPTLSAFRWALSSVTSAAWYSHPSYRLNVKLKLFLLPALKRLRTLLLGGSASALLPLFKAFTVINDGLNPSLACLPPCKPGCNHPFSCSSPSCLSWMSALQCLGEDRDKLHCSSECGYQAFTSVTVSALLHTARHSVAFAQIQNVC